MRGFYSAHEETGVQKCRKLESLHPGKLMKYMFPEEAAASCRTHPEAVPMAGELGAGECAPVN